MGLPPPHFSPLPFHDALASYLQKEEPETWAWFASAQAQSDYAESLRLDLLKKTYRLEAQAYPELFVALSEATTKLGLEVPATLYQSQSNRESNAALCYLPGEAHVVFEGSLLQSLNPQELRALLGHELAHYRLWSEQGQRYLIADRIIQAMAGDSRAEPSQVETARLMRLYTEIYADRGSFLVTGEAAPAIACLLKTSTGLSQVDVDSYLRQADEIFSKSKVRTEGLSHPESFIRARALSLWAAGTADVESEITRMIEGPLALDRLDLLGQARLTDRTRRWLQLHLRAPWFQTEPVRAHARLFFEDFVFPSQTHEDDSLLVELREAENDVRDYFCYTLLDFAVADPELEEEPLKAAFALAHLLDWDDRLEALTIKELKYKKRDAQRLHTEALPPASSEGKP